MKRIYLDYAATTPVDKDVLAAMKPYFSENFGNPSSLHRYGQIAEAAVFEARLRIAGAIGVKPEEIIFTGSATEANNLALRAIIKNVKIKNQNDNEKFKNLRPKIIISAIEHESIAETARDLEKDGVEVVVIPVNQNGFVDLEKLKAALDERIVLVSIMYANNEVGTIQPISKIADIIRDYKKGKIATQSLAMTEGGITNYPLLHTDAAQAFQYLPCRVDDLGVDMMTLSAHKIYGPKGIGLLYQKSKIKNQNKGSDFIASMITGGEQERGVRAGTENVPYIVGFGKAVEIAEKMREKEAKRVGKLRDYMWSRIKKEGMESNGAIENRLPNNLNVYIAGRSAQEMLIALDINGIAASSGSACSAHTTEPSKVIMALGYSCERALASLRFTLGRQTTKADIDKTIKILIKYLRA